MTTIRVLLYHGAALVLTDTGDIWRLRFDTSGIPMIDQIGQGWVGEVRDETLLFCADRADGM